MTPTHSRRLRGPQTVPSAVPDPQQLGHAWPASPAAGRAAPGRPLVGVDQLPVVVGDELRAAATAATRPASSAWSAPSRDRPRPGRRPACRRCPAESFLLLPITPDGPRLIQPTTYSLRLPSIRPSVCGMVPGPLVERQPGRRHTAVADGADHQLRGQFLARAGVLGDQRPLVVGHQLVAAEHDRRDPAVALDLDRRRAEPEHDAALGPSRLRARRTRASP